MFGTMLKSTTHTLVHGLRFIERRILITHDIVNHHGLKEARRKGRSG
jgi:hypothetical protein